MRFGICCGTDKIGMVGDAGYDYVELALNRLDSSKEGVRAVRDSLANAGIGADVCNCFFPSDIPLYGDEKRIREYAKERLAAAGEIGVGLAVFGCGRLRATPSGMTKAEAEDRLLHLLGILGDIGRDSGVRIVIEPLCRIETDLINTVPEGLAFCRRLGHPNVGCLLDFFHFWKEGETLEELDGFAPEKPAHVHLARANPDRMYPTDDDLDTLKIWFRKLKELGYDDRISLECIWYDQFDEVIRDTARIVRSAWNG